jgi:hypothetical protein
VLISVALDLSNRLKSLAFSFKALTNMKNANIIISVIVGLIIFFSMMILDKVTGAEWAVSPKQIAQANAKGKMVGSGGTVTGRPIRKSNAGSLPYKWAFFGFASGAICFVYLRRRRADEDKSDEK